MSTALFVTRSQPFHLGHLEVIKWILEKYDRVLIVVGSCKKSHTKKNPFTFEERREMIDQSLLAESIANDKYEIVGIPDVPSDEDWVKSISDKEKFDVVFTHNPRTEECFDAFNIPVKEHPKFGKISGSNIRNMLIKNQSAWKNSVPGETAEVIEKIDIKERLH